MPALTPTPRSMLDGLAVGTDESGASPAQNIEPWDSLSHGPTWLSERTPEPPWLVKGLVAQNAITLISGPRKLARKTWFLDSMVLALTSGRSTIPGLTTEITVSNVIYVQEEGGENQARDRIQALADASHVNTQKLDRLQVAFRQNVKIDTGTWQAKICNQVRYLRQQDPDTPVVVAIDPLTFVHNRDENDAGEMGKVTDAIRQIRDAGCTVMLIVHTGKTGRYTQDIDDAMRGSSKVADMYDNHIALRSWKPTPYVYLEARHRNAEERFGLLYWEIRTDKDGVAIHAQAVNTPHDSKEEAIKSIKQLTNDKEDDDEEEGKPRKRTTRSATRTPRTTPRRDEHAEPETEAYQANYSARTRHDPGLQPRRAAKKVGDKRSRE